MKSLSQIYTALAPVMRETCHIHSHLSGAPMWIASTFHGLPRNCASFFAEHVGGPCGVDCPLSGLRFLHVWSRE